MSHTPPPGAKGPSWPGGRRGTRGPRKGSHPPTAPPHTTGPADPEPDPHVVRPAKPPADPPAEADSPQDAGPEA